jgi:hypothetical protein
MKRVFKTASFLMLTLVVIFASVDTANAELITTKTTETICFFPMADVNELKTDDIVRFTNCHVDNATRLQWKMEGYFPKLELFRENALYLHDRFTVKKNSDGTFGFYIISPYVSLPYFISGFGATDVDLQQGNSGDPDDYKWGIYPGQLPATYAITYANPKIFTPTTLYLYGSPVDPKPLLAPPAAGQTKGTQWAIEKGMPVTVKFNKSAYWENSVYGKGYNATITITNNGEHTINLWEIEFYFPSTIDQINNARIIKQDGRYYKIANDGWNKLIVPGASRTFYISGVPLEDYDYPYAFNVITH